MDITYTHNKVKRYKFVHPVTVHTVTSNCPHCYFLAGNRVNSNRVDMVTGLTQNGNRSSHCVVIEFAIQNVNQM